MANPWEEYAEPKATEAAPWDEFAKPDKPAPYDPNGIEGGVPKWGRNHPNLYAATMTGLDMAPALAAFAGPAVGIPLAGAINTGAKAIQRKIGGEDQDAMTSLGDFAKGATVEGAGRGVAKGLQAVTNIPAVKQGADTLAKKLYQSAMKFSTSPTVLPASERAAITETGLRNNFLPKDSDYLRLKDMVGVNTGKVDSIIDAGTARGDTVSADALLKSGDMAGLLNYGNKVRGVYSGHHGATYTDEVNNVIGNLKKGEASAPYTPTDINASKRQLYKELEDAYANNTLSQPTTQARKQLARGHKLVLEEMYPEIGKLNANSKELLDLSDHLARSIGRVQNRDIIGLGDKVVLDTLGSIPKGESAVGKTLWGSVISALDRPMVKAKLAQVLYKANTGRNLPLSQWQKGVRYIGQTANTAPVRGAFDAAVLTSDPLGIRGGE